MKRQGVCTKCGKPDPQRILGEFHASGAGNGIRIGLLRGIAVTRYVCLSCGFVEEWVEGDFNLEKLAKKLGRTRE